ncbi:MAG: hypothetical protein AAGA55_00150, partial [Planctomycetota bacterium]
MIRSAALLLVMLCCSVVFGQGSAEDYARADRLPGGWVGLVRNGDVAVKWLDANTPVYLYEREDGTSEWRTVDLETGEVRAAFDAGKIALALRAMGVEAAGEMVWFDFAGDRLIFVLSGDPRVWAWAGDRLAEVAPDQLPVSLGLRPIRAVRTRGGGPATSLFVVNATGEPVELLWLDHGRAVPP